MDIQTRLDTFLSTVTGHGTSKDRLSTFVPDVPPLLEDEQLAWLYDGNDLISSMIDRMPSEALREGFTVVPKVDGADGEDPETIDLGEQIVHALDDLGVSEKIHEAMVWESVFGGSIALMLTDDADNPAAPMALDRITKLYGLRVYDRRFVEPYKLVEDVLSPNYGKPSVFRIHSKTETAGTSSVHENEFYVHASRCLVFPGIRKASRDVRTRTFWGMSKIEKTLRAFRDHSIAWSGVGNLMAVIGQGTWSMDQFLEALAEGKEDMILKRLSISAYAASTINSVVVDAERESFKREPYNLSGIENVLREYNQRLSGAADQPMTVFFGMSPAGMNATGESDRKIWNDKVKVVQDRTIAPILDRLIEVLTRAKDGPTAGRPLQNWDLKFKPLQQLSELEHAELRLKQAQVDAIEIDKQIMFPEEIALSRHRPTGYSTETVLLDREARELALEDESERSEQGESEADLEADAGA